MELSAILSTFINKLPGVIMTFILSILSGRFTQVLPYIRILVNRYITRPGLEVIKLEYSLRLKIKRNDWLLADTCPQAANHCALF